MMLLLNSSGTSESLHHLESNGRNRLLPDDLPSFQDFFEQIERHFVALGLGHWPVTSTIIHWALAIYP